MIKRAILLTIMTLLLHSPAIAEGGAALERLHRGIYLIAPPAGRRRSRQRPLVLRAGRPARGQMAGG